MMIDLILTVCMVSNPGQCHDERLTFESRGSLNQCMMLSSPYVAKWVGDHPQYKVKRWRCDWPEKRKFPI